MAVPAEQVFHEQAIPLGLPRGQAARKRHPSPPQIDIEIYIPPLSSPPPTPPRVLSVHSRG